ncbi:MAG: peptide chain release factor 2 [bacterium]
MPRKSPALGGYFDLDKIKRQIAELESEMTEKDFWQDENTAKAVGQKYNDLKTQFEDWQKLKSEADELLSLSKISENDEELEKEILNKFLQLEKEFNRLEFFFLFSGQYDTGSAVISIHAGTGGVDAQDWAQILMRMYLRFCERHKFKTKILDQNDGAEAGLKSVVLEVLGVGAYGWLKSENGVHRLVRISPFDAEKMRHTSFALVEVLPDITEDAKFEVKDSDLKIEVMRAGGHGGQSVNTTDSAVRITHVPSGLSVKCQNERSQLQNKNTAMKILRGKLHKYFDAQENDKLKKIKGDYQKAEWGAQARSYVMQPYQLVKDHRTEYETPDISRVLDGEIDDFVESYLRSKVVN